MTPDNKRLIEEARTIYNVPRYIMYPSRNSAAHVRGIIKSLADALEQADKPAPPSYHPEAWNPFRPTYRELTDDKKALHDAVKDKATELLNLVQTIKPGRYRSLSITALEESIMWAVKELTA